MNVRLTALVCAAALSWAGGVWAEGEQAEVISADGQTVTKYATMEAAVGSLAKAGCTVRMLAASANVTARAPVAKSCTIDLCGHEWKSAGDHGILISPGATVVISNGMVSGSTCLFHLEGDSRLDVFDCDLRTSYLVYCDSETASIHLQRGTVFEGTAGFTSAWGSSNLRIHVYDGAFCSFPAWHDNANLDGKGIPLNAYPATPRVQVHGGTFGRDPTKAVVDDGKFVLVKTVSKTSRVTGNTLNANFVVGANSDPAAKAEYDAGGAEVECAAFATVRAATLLDAIAMVKSVNSNGTVLRRFYNGATLRMRASANLGAPQAFPGTANVTNTLDLGGFDLTGTDGFLQVQGCLSLTNGRLYTADDGLKTAVYLNVSDSQLFCDETVEFYDPPGSTGDRLAFVLNGNNTHAVLDGTKIGMNLYSSWNATGLQNACITVKGNALFTGKKIEYASSYSADYVDIRGGSWSKDPSKYVHEGCVYYNRGSVAATPPWYVEDFAHQSYDLGGETEVHIFTNAVPAGLGLIEMTVKGEMPEGEPRVIADYTGVEGYQDLAFALKSSEPGTLAYRSGKLSVVKGKMPFVWVGGSPNGNRWTDGENWLYGSIPGPGESVTVSNEIVGATIDLNVPVSLNDITFAGTEGVTVTGETLTLTSSKGGSETASGMECLHAYVPVTLDVPVAFTGANGSGFFNHTNAKNANGYGLEFRRKVTFDGKWFICASLQANPVYATTCFRDELVALNAEVLDQYQHNNVLDFYGKVTCKGAHFSVWNTANVSFYAADNEWGSLDPGSNGTLHFRAAGACCATGDLHAGYDKNNDGSTHTINLGNFDTTANRLVSGQEYLDKPYEPTADGKRCSIRSYGSSDADQKPVTLTLNAASSAICDMRLVDRISLVYNPTDVASVQTFTNRTHLTSGTITVNRGTLRLCGQIAFANVPKVTLADNARLELLSLKDKAFERLAELRLGAGAKFALAASATHPFNSATEVILDDGAAFELEAGASATVGSLYDAKKGEYVADGTYTGEDGVAGATKVAWIVGGGTVTVDGGTTATWKASASGNWDDAANWTTDPAGARVTTVRISNRADEDITVTVRNPAALPKTLTLLSESGRTVNLAVNADVTAADTFIDLGTGTRLTVGSGATFLYDGANAAASSATVPVRIHDGGEFRVDGGTAVFTNLTGMFEISGTLDATGRVTVASGDFLVAPKANDSRVQVNGGGLFEAQGGTVRIVTQPGCEALRTNGGRIAFANDAKLVADSATADLNNVKWAADEGDSVFSGTASYRHNGKPGYGTMYVMTGVEGGVARLAVLDQARLSGQYDWFYVGYGSAKDAKGVFEVDTTSALRDDDRSSLGNVICVAGAPYDAPMTDGEMILRNGTVNTGDRGVWVGWYGNFNAKKDVGSAATGVLRISGGTLTMVANCWDGNNGANLAPIGGLVAGVGLQGTPRTGVVELSGGEIYNQNGSLLLGMSSTGAGRYVQTGGSYSGPRGDNRKVVVGAGGGDGFFAISNGTFAAGGSAWVGGVLTNEFVFVNGSAVTWADHGYTADRHDAKGTFVFAGGTFSLAQPMVVGADGEGTFERYGSAGSITLDGLVLSNATKSVVRFKADANGLKAVKVTNELVITDGAELEIDLSGYTGSRVAFTLFDCGSITGAFDPAKVSWKLAPGMPQDFALTRSGGRLRFSSPRGLAVIIR